MTLGEHPEFSEEAKREIRWALNEVWQRDHREKNSTSNPHEADAVSERMRRFETYMEKVGRL